MYQEIDKVKTPGCCAGKGILHGETDISDKTARQWLPDSLNAERRSEGKIVNDLSEIIKIKRGLKGVTVNSDSEK